jgi:hypothetical protein
MDYHLFSIYLYTWQIREKIMSTVKQILQYIIPGVFKDLQKSQYIISAL